MEFYGILWNSMDIYEILWISTDIMYTYKHIQYRLEHLHTHSVFDKVLTGAFTTTKFNLVFGSDMCLLGIIRPNEY